MKKNALLLLLFTLCLVLSGCSCKHEWVEAACTSPKTCALCKKTEGESLGHDWKNATCANPETCVRCGETRGTEKGHDYAAATCADPKNCKICGAIEGTPLGHNWVDATCTEPKACKVCGAHEGEALGHSSNNWAVIKESSCTEAGIERGVCDICGEEVERPLGLKEHTPGDWIITEEPTENSEGEHVKECALCGTEVAREKFSMSKEEIAARYKKQCKKIPYSDLARTPGEYEGELVKFSGKVVQVCSEASSPEYYSTYRVSTSGSYKDIVYIYVDNYGSGTRILEDDRITFYGKFHGLYTYTTVLGSSITIPSMIVEYVD